MTPFFTTRLNSSQARIGQSHQLFQPVSNLSFSSVRSENMNCNKMKNDGTARSAGSERFFFLSRLILFLFLSVTNRQNFHFSKRKENFRNNTRLLLVFDCLSAFQLAQYMETQQPGMWQLRSQTRHFVH